MDNTKEYFLEEIKKEMNRQDDKWGIQSQHPATWLTILQEEIGEVAKEICEGRFNIDNIDKEKYKNELIQCGAVIVQMLKDTEWNKF